MLDGLMCIVFTAYNSVWTEFGIISYWYLRGESDIFWGETKIEIFYLN